ncbi:MAG: tripartite tricarboxylate transporter permease [Syntrophaceae bacterium]|nr:tripartite tricarboxylate transporter permease [Syntrophaceae bacterium]
MGTLVGILPGLGPVGAMAILLPVTFHMSSTSAIIMLAGVFYGTAYGGSTTSILMNVPGEAVSVVTCLDGHQMAVRGRAGAALGIAAFGSFIAGTLGIVGLMIFAGPLSRFALAFGPHEYFALIVLGLTFVAYLSSQGSVFQALMVACVGLMLGNIGLDSETIRPRFTFGSLYLFDGLNIAVLAMGLFGIAEVLEGLERAEASSIVKTKIKNLLPNKADWLKSAWPIIRGTFIGFVLGILPGAGPVLASFLAYGVEKKISKEPEQFGKGAIEGVASPESANNSASSSAFIPLLTLGIPPTAAMAVLFGAFIIHGVTPGPLLIQKHPDLFWGLICSMYVGNVMLLVLNLPMIPIWVQILRIPEKFLYPLILLFCLIGAYSINNNVFDILAMLVFGVVGYIFRKFSFPVAPLILAFVLGGLLDENLRQALIISDGSFASFFTRPICVVVFCLVAAVLIFAGLSKQKQGFGDEV